MTHLKMFESSSMSVSYLKKRLNTLSHHNLSPVRDPDVGHIGPRGVIAGHALPAVVGPQPAVLGLGAEAALLHRVPRQLAHVAAGEFPHLDVKI